MELEESKLNAKKENSLSDSDFALVWGKGKNKVRKLPIHDAAHARNALARFNQTDFPAGVNKAAVLKKIKAAAKRHGVEVDTKKKERTEDWIADIQEIRRIDKEDVHYVTETHYLKHGITEEVINEKIMDEHSDAKWYEEHGFPEIAKDERKHAEELEKIREEEHKEHEHGEED